MFFYLPASARITSHLIDICTVAIKNIRNMHAVSTNQITDSLHFNGNGDYFTISCAIAKISMLIPSISGLP